MVLPSVRSRSIAYAALVATTALWGSNPVASKIVMEALPPITVATLRWVLVLVLLAPFVWGERRAVREAVIRRWRAFLPFALIGFAPQNTLVYLGLHGSTATNLALMNSAIPILVLLIGWGWYRRRPHPFEMAGIAASMFGVLLIIGHGDPLALLRLQANPWDLVLLVAMSIWALYTIRLRVRPDGLSIGGFVFVCATIGVVIASPLVLAELAATGVSRPHPQTFVALVYIAALPTLAGMMLFGFAVERVGPVQASVLAHLVPVFGSAFAVFVLGERLEPYHLAGFVAVAGGAILSCLRQEPMLSSRPPAKS